jgi:IS5 family transposase
MCQTKKGKQWYFGMKAHIGVDSRSKLIHSVSARAAHVHHSQLRQDPLHAVGRAVSGLTRPIPDRAK